MGAVFSACGECLERSQKREEQHHGRFPESMDSRGVSRTLSMAERAADGGLIEEAAAGEAQPEKAKVCLDDEVSNVRAAALTDLAELVPGKGNEEVELVQAPRHGMDFVVAKTAATETLSMAERAADGGLIEEKPSDSSSLSFTSSLSRLEEACEFPGKSDGSYVSNEIHWIENPDAPGPVLRASSMFGGGGGNAFGGAQGSTFGASSGGAFGQASSGGGSMFMFGQPPAPQPQGALQPAPPAQGFGGGNFGSPPSAAPAGFGSPAPGGAGFGQAAGFGGGGFGPVRGYDLGARPPAGSIGQGASQPHTHREDDWQRRMDALKKSLEDLEAGSQKQEEQRHGRKKVLHISAFSIELMKIQESIDEMKEENAMGLRAVMIPRVSRRGQGFAESSESHASFFTGR